MIQLTPQMRILLAVEPVDFRRGIDGLVQLCREVFLADPMSGSLFVFRSRRGSSLKLLTYDGQGFWLCQKRLSTGRFGWWPQSSESGACQLAVHELQLLLWNGDPTRAATAPTWKSVAMAT
jgi:transposase